MSKNTISIALVVVVVLAVVGITTIATGDSGRIVIDQRIAGSIFNGLEVTVDPINQVTANRTMLNLYAKGAPGEAHAEVVGGAIPVGSPSGNCPADTTDLELTFVDGGFVETFNDHSLLFYVVDPSPEAKNALCVDFTGPSTGIFDYIIVGGAGRFQDATGSATVEVTAWAVTGQLSGEQGTIYGEIFVP